MSTKILKKILRQDEYLIDPMFETQKPSAFLFENRGDQKISVVSKTKNSPIYTMSSNVVSNQSVKVNFLEKLTSFCLSQKNPCEAGTPVSGIIHAQGIFDIYINGELRAIDIPDRAIPGYIHNQFPLYLHSKDTGNILENESFYDVQFSCFISGFDVTLFDDIVSFSIEGSEDNFDIDELYNNWLYVDWYQEDEDFDYQTTEVMSNNINTLTLNFSREVNVDDIAPLHNSKYSVSTDRKSMTFYYPIILIPEVHERLEPYSGDSEG